MKSFEELLNKANAGDVPSKFLVGASYLNGSNGAPCKPSEGAIWLMEAADAGDGDSQNYYGKCLLNGIGVKKDPAKAEEQFEKAAKQGHPEALEFLCRAYRKGADGIKKNPEKALDYSTKAVDGFKTIISNTDKNDQHYCLLCWKLGGAYINKGAINRDMGNYKDTIEDYRNGQLWLRKFIELNGAGLPPQALEAAKGLLNSTENDIKQLQGK